MATHPPPSGFCAASKARVRQLRNCLSDKVPHQAAAITAILAFTGAWFAASIAGPTDHSASPAAHGNGANPTAAAAAAVYQDIRSFMVDPPFAATEALQAVRANPTAAAEGAVGGGLVSIGIWVASITIRPRTRRGANSGKRTPPGQ